jgi:hypothetical protein
MARARPWSRAWVEGSPYIPDKEGAGWAFRVWDDRFFHRGGPHAVSRGSTRGLFSSTSVGPARDRSANGPRNVTQCWADV